MYFYAAAVMLRCSSGAVMVQRCSDGAVVVQRWCSVGATMWKFWADVGAVELVVELWSWFRACWGRTVKFSTASDGVAAPPPHHSFSTLYYQVGTIVASRTFVQFLCVPFWIGIAEKYKKHKNLLMFSLIAWLLSTISILLIPKEVSMKSVNYFL